MYYLSLLTFLATIIALYISLTSFIKMHIVTKITNERKKILNCYSIILQPLMASSLIKETELETFIFGRLLDEMYYVFKILNQINYNSNTKINEVNNFILDLLSNKQKMIKILSEEKQFKLWICFYRWKLVNKKIRYITNFFDKIDFLKILVNTKTVSVNSKVTNLINKYFVFLSENGTKPSFRFVRTKLVRYDKFNYKKILRDNNEFWEQNFKSLLKSQQFFIKFWLKHENKNNDCSLVYSVSWKYKQFSVKIESNYLCDLHSKTKEAIDLIEKVLVVNC